MDGNKSQLPVTNSSMFRNLTSSHPPREIPDVTFHPRETLTVLKKLLFARALEFIFMVKCDAHVNR